MRDQRHERGGAHRQRGDLGAAGIKRHRPLLAAPTDG
jgi:hypothetical protein